MIDNEEFTEDLRNEEYVEEQVESGEMSLAEAAFTHGYYAEEE